MSDFEDWLKKKGNPKWPPSIMVPVKAAFEAGHTQPTTPADSPVISEDEYTALAAISEENYRRWYMELIYSVQSKFDGETRHETALRYIKQAESTCYGPEVASDE